MEAVGRAAEGVLSGGGLVDCPVLVMYFMMTITESSQSRSLKVPTLGWVV